MKSLYFTAGQFARLHQLNKRTLHYYDDIGLFSPAYKGENGYRYYTYQQSAQLENILAMRQLNMSIEEIAAYLKHPNPQDFLKISQNRKSTNKFSSYRYSSRCSNKGSSPLPAVSRFTMVRLRWNPLLPTTTCSPLCLWRIIR